MSVFFDIENKLNLNKITRINCLILQKSLQKFTDYKVEIKKPNDILINKKKVCGILQETTFKQNRKYLIVGIGINVSSSPRINNYSTTSLNKYSNKELNRIKLFKEIKLLYEKNIHLFGA